jgi:hypothetical protein
MLAKGKGFPVGIFRPFKVPLAVVVVSLRYVRRIVGWIQALRKSVIEHGFLAMAECCMRATPQHVQNRQGPPESEFLLATLFDGFEFRLRFPDGVGELADGAIVIPFFR